MTIDEHLLRYLAVRERQRAGRVRAVLDAMTDRERHLVREAAVMGYVRGVLGGKVGRSDIPPDSAILADVIAACLSMCDLYPAINGLAGIDTEETGT